MIITPETPIHRDVPFTSSGSHFGWASCRECSHRLMAQPTTRGGRTTGYSNPGVWKQAKEWNERIYKEMWEDYVRTHLQRKRMNNGQTQPHT